ncbi:MAG: T9SS type A sorting domain-containing protein [Flavobacteriales bacterium]|nr:T9SS type A sorting domain-containing protein [Flavobacteriales bacterium]
MGGGIAIRNQDRGLLLKFNAIGDTLWTKQFGDTTNFRTFRQAIPTRDGGFAVVGEYGAVGQRADGWLVKTDSLGNLEWERYYSVSLGTEEALSSVFQTTDGGYILGGRELQFPNQSIRNEDPIVIKVDSLGNQQWRYRYDTQFNDANAYVLQTQDGNFVIGASTSYSQNVTGGNGNSRATLVKLNANGTQLWAKQFGFISSNHAFLTVKELPNGDLIAVGRRRHNTAGKIEGLMVKTKANGDSIWVNTYENDANGLFNQNYLWDVIQLPDGGFMAAGEVLGVPPHASARQDPWVIRVDSNGCILQNCLIGIDDSKGETNKHNLSIYPNPTNGVVNIETSLKIKTVIIYNAQGQTIKEIKNPTSQFELPKARGIYFLRIETDSGKIIKQKIIKT